jgi:hypothetical protein
MTTTTTTATAQTTQPTWTAGRLLTAVGNEIVKGLRHGWSERLQILIELPLFVAFVLLLGFTVGKGTTIATTGRLDWSLDPRQAGWLLVGMATFTYTYLHVQKMFWRLLAEIQAGTLEQTYLSPLPSWVHVAGGRVLAAIAETTVVVAVMYAVTSLAVPLDLHWRADVLVPLALLVTGAAGTTSPGVGLGVHLLLAALFGMLFALVVPRLRTNGTIALAGTVYGALLYVVNFLVLAPLAFTAFEDANQPFELLPMWCSARCWGLRCSVQAPAVASRSWRLSGGVVASNR